VGIRVVLTPMSERSINSSVMPSAVRTFPVAPTRLQRSACRIGRLHVDTLYAFRAARRGAVRCGTHYRPSRSAASYGSLNGLTPCHIRLGTGFYPPTAGTGGYPASWPRAVPRRMWQGVSPFKLP
jgi:hypothetical protein